MLEHLELTSPTMFQGWRRLKDLQQLRAMATTTKMIKELRYAHRLVCTASLTTLEKVNKHTTLKVKSSWRVRMLKTCSGTHGELAGLACKEARLLRCHLWDLPCDSFQLARMWLDQSGPFEEKADSFEQGLWYTVWYVNTITLLLTVLMHTTAILNYKLRVTVLKFWFSEKLGKSNFGAPVVEKNLTGLLSMCQMKFYPITFQFFRAGPSFQTFSVGCFPDGCVKYVSVWCETFHQACHIRGPGLHKWT